MTDLGNCAWRSDLGRIEVLNENEFVEYTKDGYATRFTTTVFQPCERWEFDMENGNMKGHWTGVFYRHGDKTTVVFSEDVSAKKLFLKPFVGGYLKKQQLQYFEDLKAALGC
ncbi:MAG: polyketide cyclase [Lachnospiraceae bacterium]|nr:polyketide cyclase [Lachnospiraceae bacterium]